MFTFVSASRGHLCDSTAFLFGNDVALYINSHQSISTTVDIHVDIHVAYLVCLGHNKMAFFNSDLAVKNVMFASKHRKLVGNPDRRMQ